MRYVSSSVVGGLPFSKGRRICSPATTMLRRCPSCPHAPKVPHMVTQPTVGAYMVQPAQLAEGAAAL